METNTDIPSSQQTSILPSPSGGSDNMSDAEDEADLPPPSARLKRQDCVAALPAPASKNTALLNLLNSPPPKTTPSRKRSCTEQIQSLIDKGVLDGKKGNRSANKTKEIPPGGYIGQREMFINCDYKFPQKLEEWQGHLTSMVDSALKDDYGQESMATDKDPKDAKNFLVPLVGLFRQIQMKVIPNMKCFELASHARDRVSKIIVLNCIVRGLREHVRSFLQLYFKGAPTESTVDVKDSMIFGEHISKNRRITMAYNGMPLTRTSNFNIDVTLLEIVFYELEMEMLNETGCRSFDDMERLCRDVYAWLSTTQRILHENWFVSKVITAIPLNLNLNLDLNLYSMYDSDCAVIESTLSEFEKLFRNTRHGLINRGIHV
jgi:hypothetical protein